MSLRNLDSNWSNIERHLFVFISDCVIFDSLSNKRLMLFLYCIFSKKIKPKQTKKRSQIKIQLFASKKKANNTSSISRHVHGIARSMTCSYCYKTCQAAHMYDYIVCGTYIHIHTYTTFWKHRLAPDWAFSVCNQTAA